ncbi:MAG: hypothetical protein LBP65_01815 [Puniceicoccales bacterium]|jgi:hypothetical protein|nr:hypothetical protein [Puniceicoccales bacterium]
MPIETIDIPEADAIASLMARKEQICVQVSSDVHERIRRDAEHFQFSQSECVRRIVQDFYAGGSWASQDLGTPINAEEMDRLSTEAQSPHNPLRFHSMAAALDFLNGAHES